LRDNVVKNNSFHDAGIVHQHIDLAVPVANGLHECQHIWPHRYVTLNYLDLRVFFLQLINRHVIPPTSALGGKAHHGMCVAGSSPKPLAPAWLEARDRQVGIGPANGEPRVDRIIV